MPAIVWPEPYPANTLTAMRAATWAAQQGAGRQYARAAYSMAFAEGIDLTDPAALTEAAERAGLDGASLPEALADPAIKAALRAANDAAITEGVYGVPTFDAGGLLWWGDHQLEAAAFYHHL